MICQKIWNGFAPSIIAASVRSAGIFMKNWRTTTRLNALISPGTINA
jgi:hypothetical protein